MEKALQWAKCKRDRIVEHTSMTLIVFDTLTNLMIGPTRACHSSYLCFFLIENWVEASQDFCVSYPCKSGYPTKPISGKLPHSRSAIRSLSDGFVCIPRAFVCVAVSRLLKAA